MADKEAEFDYEKYRKTKEYKNMMKDVVKNIQEIVFFKPKEREKLKKKFLNLQKSALKNMEATSTNSQSLEERKDFLFNEKILDTATGYLELIKKGEEYEKKITLLKTRFVLYKKGKKYVFAISFVRKSTGKRENTHIFIKNGLPKGKKRKKAKIVRKKFNSSGFKEIDRGTFEQKIPDIKNVYFTFKGKKVYKFRYERFKKDKDEGWLSNV